MAAKTSLTVSYTLCPPEGTNPLASLPSTGSHSFAVEADNGSNGEEYYTALRKSIAAAREKLGEELTAWRDAVGNGELGKEKAAKEARAEDEEEDEEGYL